LIICIGYQAGIVLHDHVSEISSHAAICNKARKLVLQCVSPIQIEAEVSTHGFA